MSKARHKEFGRKLNDKASDYAYRPTIAKTQTNHRINLLVRMIQDGRIDLKPILKYVQECFAKQQQRLAGEKMDRSKEIVLPEYDRKKTGLDDGMLYSAASSLRRSDGL